MSLSIKQLEIFVATARTGYVSAAANKLFCTQSAASMTLNQLETVIGTKLFNRVGKRLVLNNVGKKLLPKAEEILQRIAEFYIEENSDQLRGTVVIGASKTIGTYWLPPLLKNFLQKHPEVNVEYTIDNTDTVIKKILSSEIEVGFIESDCNHSKLTVQTVATDQLIVVADKKHPLAKSKSIVLHDLANYSWIFRESGSGTRKIFENHVKDFFAQLTIFVELNEPEAIKKMLLNSDMLTCLSRKIVQQELDSQQLVALTVQDFNVYRSFSMIQLANQYQTTLLKEFSKFFYKNN